MTFTDNFPRGTPALRLAGLLALMVLLAIIWGCDRQESPQNSGGIRSAEGKLRVVATFSIMGDVAANIAGDRAAITTLVGRDSDAHTYEPSPSDAAALARADVLVESGLGFEIWLDKLYVSSDSKARRVVASEGVVKRQFTENGQTETDPHFWQNPANMIAATSVMAEGLSAADPAFAAVYRANASAYQAKLKELDQSIEQKVRALPSERRVLLTSHDSLGYFADRYGFKVAGGALTFMTTEAGDPSAQQMAALIKKVRTSGVPAVFVENMNNPKIMQQIAREAGVKIDTTLYTDALGAEGSTGESYLKMMQYNADTIVEALKP